MVIQKEKLPVKAEYEGSFIPATWHPLLKADEAAKMDILNSASRRLALR